MWPLSHLMLDSLHEYLLRVRKRAVGNVVLESISVLDVVRDYLDHEPPTLSELLTQVVCISRRRRGASPARDQFDQVAETSLQVTVRELADFGVRAESRDVLTGDIGEDPEPGSCTSRPRSSPQDDQVSTLQPLHQGLIAGHWHIPENKVLDDLRTDMAGCGCMLVVGEDRLAADIDVAEASAAEESSGPGRLSPSPRSICLLFRSPAACAARSLGQRVACCIRELAAVVLGLFLVVSTVSLRACRLITLGLLRRLVFRRSAAVISIAGHQLAPGSPSSPPPFAGFTPPMFTSPKWPPCNMVTGPFPYIGPIATPAGCCGDPPEPAPCSAMARLIRRHPPVACSDWSGPPPALRDQM